MGIDIEYDANNAIDDLLALYHTYGWWDDRTKEDLRRALRHTNEVVILRDHDTDTVVGAARVLSDYVYYTTVYDVVVTEDRRGDGLGQRLIQAVIDHPNLTETKGFSLLCREGLVPFYRSCGLELGDQNIEHPDGSPEPLRRMRYRRG